MIKLAPNTIQMRMFPASECYFVLHNFLWPWPVTESTVKMSFGMGHVCAVRSSKGWTELRLNPQCRSDAKGSLLWHKKAQKETKADLQEHRGIEQVAGDHRAGRGRAGGRKHKTDKSRQQVRVQARVKNILLSQSQDRGAGNVPRGMKQWTGDEWRERPAFNSCRCEEQGSKVMSSRCAEVGGCSRDQKAPPSPGGRENMDTQRAEADWILTWAVCIHMGKVVHHTVICSNLTLDLNTIP